MPEQGFSQLGMRRVYPKMGMRMKNIMEAPKMKFKKNYSSESNTELLEHLVTGVMQNVKFRKEPKRRLDIKRKEENVCRNSQYNKLVPRYSIPGNLSRKTKHEKRHQKQLILTRQRNIVNNPSTLSTFYGFI